MTVRRAACLVLALGLAMLPACRQNAAWQMRLTVLPDNPSMVKPITFSVHITDANAQPVANAEVTGVLTMKTMDMGKTELRFTSKGNGDYEAFRPDMDMSGPWVLTLEAAQGSTRAKQSFDFTVGD